MVIRFVVTPLCRGRLCGQPIFGVLTFCVPQFVLVVFCQVSVQCLVAGVLLSVVLCVVFCCGVACLVAVSCCCCFDVCGVLLWWL